MNTNEPEFWVRTSWKKEELDRKLVQFELTSPEMSVAGIGEFLISQRPTGEQRIEVIVTTAPSFWERTQHRFILRQIHADRIRRHQTASVAEFELFA